MLDHKENHLSFNKQQYYPPSNESNIFALLQEGINLKF